jgi:hypothetical protein
MGKKHKSHKLETPTAVKTEGNGAKDESELATALGVGQGGNEQTPEQGEPAPKAETAETESKAEAEATEPQAETETEGGDTDGSPEEASEQTDGTLAEMEKIAEQITDPEQKKKLLEQIRKWHAESTRSNQVKAWKAFDDDLKGTLPDIFKQMAAKHGVDLSNRQIRITFPNGVFSHTNSVVGKGKGGGNGSRQMPTRWTGKAQAGEQSHDSPNALALALGLKVTGCRDMVDVFESQGYTVTELPACERAEITIAKSDEERAKRLKALVKENGNFVVTKK